MTIPNREFTFGVIGGYGAIGSVVVAELARRRAGSILVGGRDRSRADALAAQFDLASAAFVDVHNAATLDAFCASAAIVVNCGGPVVEAGTWAAEAAFRRGCHFVDPGAGPTIDVMAPHQDEMRRQNVIRARGGGFRAVRGAGASRRSAGAGASRRSRHDAALPGRSSDGRNRLRDIAWHARHRMIPVQVRPERRVCRRRRVISRGSSTAAAARRQRVSSSRTRGRAFARGRGRFHRIRHNFRRRGDVRSRGARPLRARTRRAAWLRAAFRHDYAKRSSTVRGRARRGSRSRRRLTLTFSTLRNRRLTGSCPRWGGDAGRPAGSSAGTLSGDAVDSGILLDRLAESGGVRGHRGRARAMTAPRAAAEASRHRSETLSSRSACAPSNRRARTPSSATRRRCGSSRRSVRLRRVREHGARPGGHCEYCDHRPRGDAFSRGASWGRCVNLAGLCTRFSRSTTGRSWIELDLPPVGDVWRRVLVETARHRFVEHSVLDFAWMETVGRMAAGRPVLFIAEGLLMYFDEGAVRRLFLALSSAFSGGEILVEAVSPLMARNSRLHPAVARTRAVFAWGVASLRELERWSPRIELIEEWHHLDYHPARWGWLGTVRWIRDPAAVQAGHLRFR